MLHSHVALGQNPVTLRMPNVSLLITVGGSYPQKIGTKQVLTHLKSMFSFKILRNGGPNWLRYSLEFFVLLVQGRLRDSEQSEVSGEREGAKIQKDAKINDTNNRK